MTLNIILDLDIVILWYGKIYEKMCYHDNHGEFYMISMNITIC